MLEVPNNPVACCSGCMAEAKFDEQYHQPFERCLGRFTDKLTPERARQLARDGHVVIDNFLGDGWSLALLQEMKWLEKHG